MSLPTRRISSTGTGFPRVSGDGPAISAVKYADLMFSPRERG